MSDHPNVHDDPTAQAPGYEPETDPDTDPRMLNPRSGDRAHGTGDDADADTGDDADTDANPDNLNPRDLRPKHRTEDDA